MTTPAVDDALARLDRDPDRIVRVIVTVRPGTEEVVAAAARKAGASTADPLRGTQAVVIEGKASHVRAAADTGQVLTIQRDTPSPTN